MYKQYHLEEQPIPEGYRIYAERCPVKGVTQRKSDVASFCKAAGQVLEFEREPNNPYDPNAIKIIGIWRGWFFQKRRMLGYVDKELARKIADEGQGAVILPRLLKTYLGDDGFVEVSYQVLAPKPPKEAKAKGRKKRAGTEPTTE